jgi:hypothetical protein
MRTVIVRLDPALLENADLDIRYRLPELLAEESGGLIEDDGYDYAPEGGYEPGSKPLLLFLKVKKLAPGLDCIRRVIETIPVLGNDLRRCAVVAFVERGKDKVVYPPGFEGPFGR